MLIALMWVGRCTSRISTSLARVSPLIMHDGGDGDLKRREVERKELGGLLMAAKYEDAVTIATGEGGHF